MIVHLAAATYNIIFNADTLPDGIYFVFLQTSLLKENKKIAKSITAGVHNSKNNKSDLLVYPNPSKGVFNLYLLFNNEVPVVIEIISQSGRILHKGESKETNYCIDLTGYAKGTYFIKAISSNEVSIKKVTLQ